MKKKLIITAGILLALVGASVAGVSYAKMNAPKHPSEFNIGIKYDEALQSDKPMLAVFYVDWCGYCLRFMPKFNILSKVYKDKFNFVMINVEESNATRKLATDSYVGGYPTVYIIDPKYDNKVLMPNGVYQDLLKFRTELDRYLRIRNLLDKK